MVLLCIKWLKLLELSAYFIGEHISTAVCRSLAVIVRAASWSTVENHLQPDVTSRKQASICVYWYPFAVGRCMKFDCAAAE